MLECKNRRARLAHPLLGLSLGLALALPAQAAETLKVAQIDPVSGPLAPIGESSTKHLQAKFDSINDAGGMNGQKLEFHWGLPVDAAGELPDGRPFKDVRDFKKHPMSREAGQ